MIDGININTNVPKGSPVKGFDLWETLVNAKTMQRVTDHYTGNFRGLDLKLTGRGGGAGGYRFNIKGSLHKYANHGSHNADRFTFDRLQSSINSLTDVTGIAPENYDLNGLEIGLNINLNESPKQILNNVVSYGNKPFAAMNKKRSGLGLECTLKQYSVKIYDKGRQSKTRGDILRFEVAANKMQLLDGYGISTLADLLHPEKVYPLVALLLEAAGRIIWTDTAADLNKLTDRQQKQWLTYSNPKTWERLPKQGKVYHLRKWQNLLSTYGNITDLQGMILANWNGLFEGCELLENQPKQAQNLLPFYQPGKENESTKIVTFLPFIWTVKKYNKPHPKNPPQRIKINNNINSAKKAGKPKKQVHHFCLSCGADISHQHPESKFCSARFVGERKAKQCRNKDSNRRLSFKRKIKRAMYKDKFLAISYKDSTGATYTDVLQADELRISKKWLDRVQSIEAIPKGKEPPERLTGQAAKDFLKSISNIKTKAT